MNSNVFLFILDAVRKDHVSLYGYKRKTTPNIDKLAKQADVYNWAFAPAPYTLASVPSILAGKYPIELSNMFTGGRFNWRDFATLRNLRKQGYMTAMFTANIVTSSLKTNLNQFFDYFWDNLTERELNRPVWLYQKARTVLAAAEAFVEKHKDKKLFVVIHLMEAHGPYVPKVESIFKGDATYKEDKRIIDRLVPTTLRGVTHTTLAKYKIMPRYQALMRGDDYARHVREYIAKYDMGIYLLDKNVGRFLAFLRKNKLYETSRIIITSDHGELLGEENIFFTHGILSHPVLALVPLIIKHPDQSRSKTINQNTSLVKLIPSLLENMSQVISDELIMTMHPKSLGLAWDDKYITVHNGEFSDIGKESENLWPVESKKIEKTILELGDLKIVPWVKRFQKGKIAYCETGGKVDSDLKWFKLLLYLESRIFSQVKQKFSHPRRSEKLGLKLFFSSLLAENPIKRLWRFVTDKL